MGWAAVLRPIAAVTGREPRGLRVTARNGRSAARGPVAGGGGSPGLHEAQRRKTGETPGSWFRRGRCEPHIREPPATPNSGAGHKQSGPRERACDIFAPGIEPAGRDRPVSMLTPGPVQESPAGPEGPGRQALAQGLVAAKPFLYSGPVKMPLLQAYLKWIEHHPRSRRLPERPEGAREIRQQCRWRPDITLERLSMRSSTAQRRVTRQSGKMIDDSPRFE